ncbi:MAG: hypothetical protein FJ291_19680 [Planctomycetes bacterium]|nr:hypothetical protein [Planctomycetota bacterium]
MSAIRESLSESLRTLSDDEARQALEFVQALRRGPRLAELRGRLAGRPGYRLPSPDHKGFPSVAPAPTTGAPASELLIRDRR